MRTLTITLCFIIAYQLTAQISFQTPDTYQVDYGPTSMTLGDFDEDGFIDVVTGNSDNLSESLTILINDKSGGFLGRKDIDLSDGPQEVISGDVNGDNHLDLIVTIDNTDQVAVLLGDGDGDFGDPVYFTTGTDTTPYGVVVGNFNADAFPDIITSNRDGNNVSILTGDGSGSFSAPTFVDVGDSPWDIVSGFFDADAHLDIAVVNTLDDNLMVLLGDGTGAFPSSNTVENFFASTIELADLNDDGNPDISGNSSSAFITMLGDGLGSFGAPTNYNFCEGPGHTGDLDGDDNEDAVYFTRDFAIYTAKGDGSGALTYDVKYHVEAGSQGTLKIVDLDNDNDNDILVAGDIGSLPSQQFVTVLKNNGDGFFNAPIQYPILPLENNYEGAYALVKGDFNEDGEMDLAATSHEDDQLIIMFGNSLGRFTLPVAFATGDDPRDLLVADFNEDDHLDLITLNWNSDNMTLHLGDGNGDFSSTSNTVTSATSFNFDTADFNNDDHLDIVVSGSSGNNFGFFAGNGMGGFSAPVYISLASSVYDVRAVDANEDGNMDVAASYNSLGEVAIYLGDGMGGFNGNGSYDIGDASWIELGDINSDDHTDLVVANSTSVLLGVGDGTFTIQAISGVFGTTHMNAADMDGDGKEELIRSSQSVSSVFGEGDVTVYSLNNDLTIVDQWDSGTGSNGGFKSVIHDFNHDNQLDIATTDVNYNGIWILLNNTIAQCTAPTILTNSGAPPALCVGESTMMEITAGGDDLEYQWFKDGDPISGAMSNSFTINTNSASDAGLYRVQVTNSCGSDELTFSLTLNETPDAPTTSGNAGCNNESVVLTASGGSNGNYRWYEIESGGTAIPGQVNETYTTPSLTSATSYFVSITNGICESTRTEVVASVISSVSITTQPVSQTVDESESVTFSVTATGDNIQYQWEKDGIDISGATANTLTISSVSQSDEGAYQCVVGNDCGIEDSSVANLTVNDTSNPLNVGDKEDQLWIYPNPAAGHFTIRLPSGAGDSFSVRISDLSGKQVYFQSVKSFVDEILIETKGIIKGTYLVSILSDSKLVSYSTVIIQ